MEIFLYNESMKNIEKSKKDLSLYLVKVICVLGFLILAVTAIKAMVVYGIKVNEWSTTMQIKIFTNAVVMIVFAIVFFMPKKVEILSGVGIFYTILCTTEQDYMNVMGLFMYFLTISLLIYRGFYIQKKVLKIIITVVFMLGLYLTKLRFGFENFIDAFLQAMGYSLVFGSTLYFLFQYQKKKTTPFINSRVLDLSDYDENQLSQMDREWIELALTNEKYDSIARKYNYSLGHVKNRMRYIFLTIDVIDRIDLFSKYAGCKVIKNKEELENWRQKLLDSSSQM